MFNDSNYHFIAITDMLRIWKTETDIQYECRADSIIFRLQIQLEIALFVVVNEFKSISGQIHLPRKQRQINRKGHRNEVNESMDSYQ